MKKGTVVLRNLLMYNYNLILNLIIIFSTRFNLCRVLSYSAAYLPSVANYVIMHTWSRGSAACALNCIRCIVFYRIPSECVMMICMHNDVRPSSSRGYCTSPYFAVAFPASDFTEHEDFAWRLSLSDLQRDEWRSQVATQSSMSDN